MKKLSQAVFENAPDWVKSVAVDSDGCAWRLRLSKSELKVYKNYGWFVPSNECVRAYIGTGYDTTDWQHSAIDRE